jgi:hypothetical protein
MNRLVSLSLICIFLVSLISCSDNSSNQDPDLQRSVNFVKYLSSNRFLKKSGFRALNDEKKPSKFVSYLFSTMGSAEWFSVGDPYEEEQMKSIGVPVPPKNVFITDTYTQGAGKQIVLKGDDANSQIIVEAYGPDSGAVLFTKKIPFSG